MKCDSLFVTAWFLLGATTAAAAQTILRVDCTATDPAADGSTWIKAYPHLQDALAAAAGIAGPGNPVQIWVAECTYMPDGSFIPPRGARTAGSGDRLANFEFMNHVEVCAGYPTGGGDGSFAARDPDPKTNGTVLSGHLVPDDDRIVSDDDSVHVVVGSNTDPTSALRGFTVTAGSVGLKSNHSISVSAGGPTVTRCDFVRNNIGALVQWADVPATFLDCTFSENASTGISLTEASPRFENCEIVANGLHGVSSTSTGAPTLIGCLFANHSSDFVDGGGLSNVNADLFLVDCVFRDNDASRGGGVFLTGDGVVTMVGCSFERNSGAGSGIRTRSVTNVVTVIDCTFTENSGNAIMVDERSTLTVLGSRFARITAGGGAAM